MTSAEAKNFLPERKGGLFSRRRTRNLVLVVPRMKHLRYPEKDFQRIAEYVHAAAPDVRPWVIDDRRSAAHRLGLLLRPSFFFSTTATKRLKVLRGTLLASNYMPKSQEYLAMEKVGIPVPRWYLLTEKNSPDVKSLGEYVVVKPDCGGRGAEVRIKRAARVRWKAPTNARAVSMNQLDLIAQRFIYTGPWPVSYRVTTLFGKTLFAWQARADSKRQALLGPDRFENGGLSICSMGQGCKFELCNDREIIDLGERVHQAFPRNPLLGIDIVREQPTGKLYVIEVNSCGQVWHFSSPMGCGIQRESKIDFESQFNGIRKAADILIEQTRFLAR